MGEGDLSVRADVAHRGRHGTEITELGTQFNQMADNLQTSFAQLAAERDALRRFMADASHELRTPITALKNFNALLLSGADDDPEIREEFLRESQSQIERLAWITSHLLDLSRRDAGLVPPEIADHDLREVVRAAVAPFEPLAAEHAVTLETRFPNRVVSVRCDRAQLEMALTNLLDNALKSTAAEDSVSVSVADADAGPMITVADTGVGIQPEDLPHVFERFYRGSRQGAPYEGVGLGLAIVKSIVDAHGGTVAIDSTPGEGTRVTITLPRESTI
jgi:signal transduction histidine kinase